MKLPALIYPKESFSRFDEVIEREWILTNGLGGYSSSTLAGFKTRKYPGVLMAAQNPPGDRTVCVSKLDEDLFVEGEIFRLGSNEFGDGIFPDGSRFISEFKLNPNPTYTYVVGNIEVRKIIFLPQQKNALVVLYKIANRNASESAKVRLYPLLTCRYYHTVVDRRHTRLNFTQESNQNGFQTNFIHPEAVVICRMTGAHFVESINWVERLHYRVEAGRGEADFDDLFQPGYFEINVPEGSEKEFAVSCSVGKHPQEALQILNSIGTTIFDIDTTFTTELGYKETLLEGFYQTHPAVPISDWLNWILLAADSFLVQSNEGQKSIIAGYFWFEPWGRDTFISLPGLTLVTGKFNVAKNILRNFIRYLKGGMIPNFVADKTGVPIYNTVDGTLWYVNAVLQYIKYTSDYAFIKTDLWANLKSIIEHHQHGTMFGIRLDTDGLLLHGPRLTWMDAAVGGDMVTPRAGKAVEIQALWYNAVKTMELLALKLGETESAQTYKELAEKTRLSFNQKYWNPKLGYLYDVLEHNTFDLTLRPNQIFAVSLDYTMLSKQTSRRIVEVVDRELVTSFGLRTLSRDDPNFVGRCTGNKYSRDKAYHNGTIWPWLLGPYITAYLKVNDYSIQARRKVLNSLILPLFSVGIHQGGLGTISEIYDCDPPNTPHGCISQAWSVAEPLRAYIEDILQVKPKFEQLI